MFHRLVSMGRALKGLGILAVVISGAVAGCAGGFPGVRQDPKQVVAERAQQRWDALVAGDVAKAYSFLSPGTRQAVTLVQYSGGIRLGFWKKVQVQGVECPKEDLCEASVLAEYQRGQTIATPLRERWILSEGNWWYVQR